MLRNPTIIHFCGKLIEDVPLPAKRQHIRKQVKVTLVFVRANFVNVLWASHMVVMLVIW